MSETVIVRWTHTLSEYDGTIPELPATLQSERIPSVI